MSAQVAPGAVGARAGTRVSWLGLAVSVSIYSLFAAVVFVIHGSEPPLSADHIAYMHLADEIARLEPDGAYWKRISQIHSYGVALAYLHPLTGSHILSLKLLLAALSVFSFLAFELFIGLFSDAKWKSVLFALVSGNLVTFGASLWGYTDFSASLQRTVMVPVMLVAVWFYVSRADSVIKYLAFPVLVAASVLHLSAYYVAAVLGLLELWNWGARRRFRIDRQLKWFAFSLAIAYLVKIAQEQIGLAFTDNLAAGLVFPDAGERMDPQEAWQVELKAFPWRNMPLPFATLATIAASYGTILLVAIGGIVAARRRGFTELDRTMLVLGGAVIVLAYGPQTLLWIIRQFLPIYPLSLEETRAINMLMIPSLYFGYRFFDALWTQSTGFVPRRAIAVAAILLLVLQPIEVLPMLPTRAKEAIFAWALSIGAIRKDDSLRQQYARQLLGLENGSERFYYSARGVIEWLRMNVDRGTPVLSNLNELLLANVRAVGAFNGLLGIRVADPQRKQWAESVVEVQQAISSRDLAQVELVARKYGADLAVVPWPVSDALYRDGHYSIVKVRS
jgi:hypothetical protein